MHLKMLIIVLEYGNQAIKIVYDNSISVIHHTRKYQGGSELTKHLSAM